MTDPRELFRLDELPSELAELWQVERVWQVLERLDRFGARLSSDVRGRVHPTAIIDGPAFVAESAEIGPYALIEGPAWIGPGATVGHAAFVRGPVVLMEGARVGHASEVKRSVLLPGAKAPHFNYVGDSLLGRSVNLGAGVKIANFKTFGNEIAMSGRSTGLRKLGAAVGDGVSIGCNAVLSPGTVIGPGTVVYNGALLRGTVPAGTVVKTRMEHEISPLVTGD
jgi:NDP-sugar pyrophosphorylase family protein